MVKHPLHHLVLYALLIWLTLFSVYVFTKTIHERLYDFSQSTIVDIDIYWKAAKRYTETGLLYERFHNLKQGYAPSEPVYKFPPAYQLTLLPWLDNDANRFFLKQRWLQITAYLAACLILVMMLSADSRMKLVYICLAVILVMMARHLPDTFQNTTPECFILLLLVIAWSQIHKRPTLSGATLAVATCFKIYPVFFLLYPVIARNYRMLAGFVAGIAITTIVSVAVTNLDEHIFYLKEILPILLAERPMAYSQNLTLESLALNLHLIENMSGVMSQIVKWSTLAILIGIGINTDFTNQKSTGIYFGLLCCGVLMFLSNYWLQYQLILLIPMLYLLRSCIDTRNGMIVILSSCSMILFIIDRDWANLVLATMDHLPTEQEIKTYVDANPSSDPLWHFAPVIWCIYAIVELRPLLPVLLFSALVILHQISKSRKAC